MNSPLSTAQQTADQNSRYWYQMKADFTDFIQRVSIQRKEKQFSQLNAKVQDLFL